MYVTNQNQWELSLAESETRAFIVLKDNWSLGLPEYFCKHLTAKVNRICLLAFKSGWVKIAWGSQLRSKHEFKG